VKVFVGDTAAVVCDSAKELSSSQISDAFSVNWQKDGSALSLKKGRMVVLPSGTLIIEETETSDAGVYGCLVGLASEEIRPKFTYRINVDTDLVRAVEPSPPSFLAKPASIVKTASMTSVTLDCAASGVPKPTITWLKEGSTIDLEKSGSRFSLLGTGSLKIDKVQEKDSGTFFCRAENAEDSIDASVTLEVQVPPRFLQTPKTVEAREKDDVEFDCTVSGKPAPKIKWFKNGDEIIESEYFQVSSYIFYF
jgi:neogenin